MNRHARRALKARSVKVGKKQAKDVSPPDRKAEITNLYAQECMKAGEIQYRLVQAQLELDKVNATIESLNREYTDLVRAEQAAPVVKEK